MSTQNNSTSANAWNSENGELLRAAPTANTADIIWGPAILESAAQGSRLLPVHGFSPEHPIAQVEAAIAASARARNSITNSDLSAFGIEVSPEVLSTPLVKVPAIPRIERRLSHTKLDFFRAISSYPELIMELSKYLPMPSFVSLYSISKDFNQAVDGYLSHTMRIAASYQAQESCSIFTFNLYEHLCKIDPRGRPHPKFPNTPRKVPSLRWLQMVVYREKVIRDILACMARQGHRMPREMSLSLKKMWLLMDIATTARRVQFMHNTTFFTALDLYHIQMFIVKLDMRFNDPVDGPASDVLRKLFLGQHSLTPLRNCLKRTEFTSLVEIVKLAVRYEYTPAPRHRHLSIWGISPHEIGIGHLEGWGKGRVHLMRPDELVMREAVRRQLGLKNYIMSMMLWGYVDPVTGKNTPPTVDEKYMSDDEEKRPPVGWSDYLEEENEADAEFDHQMPGGDG
jgi:hypothetical protein